VGRLGAGSGGGMGQSLLACDTQHGIGVPLDHAAADAGLGAGVQSCGGVAFGATECRPMLSMR
jgi:hypothetical protein